MANWKARIQKDKGKKEPEVIDKKKKSNRKPIKRPTVKRKTSLTDQYKYIDENYDPKFG